MTQRRLTRHQRWRIDKIQEERAARLTRKAASVEAGAGDEGLGPERPGRVIAHFGAQLEVECTDGGGLIRCHLRANLPALVTGDEVVWRAGVGDQGVVVAQLPRRSELCRPDARGLLKPVAANIDQAILVFAPLPQPHPNLIHRYLVALHLAGIRPVLLLNKSDLRGERAESGIDLWLDIYRELGYQVLEGAAHTGSGLAELQALLDHQTSVFVGQSGVGKSSLINALLPGVNTRVGALSGSAGKGSHTTTTARLFHLPCGGDLIDSPGIREFSLAHVSRDELAYGFVEFAPYLGHCRFRDCRHQGEPGCALHKAVSEGGLRVERLNAFQALAKEVAS